MNFTDKDYIIGLWFVDGEINGQRSDVLVTVFRHTPTSPWQAQVRARKRLDDEVDYKKTKDEKKFWDIEFKEPEAFMTEAAMIAKMEESNGILAKEMNGRLDRILIQNTGDHFVEIMSEADKEWIHIKKVDMKDIDKEELNTESED